MLKKMPKTKTALVMTKSLTAEGGNEGNAGHLVAVPGPNVRHERQPQAGGACLRMSARWSG